MARGGFVAIHRSIFDHPKLQDDGDFRGFVWLLSNAAWSPMRRSYKGKDFVLERGQLTISVRDFARAMKRSAPWAQRFFARMEKAGMIARKTDTLTDTPTDTPPAVITVCNYSKYQDVREVGDTPADTPTDTQKNKRTIKPKKEEISLGDLLDQIPVKPNGKGKTPATPWKGGEDIPEEWAQWAVAKMGWAKRDAVREGRKFISHALANDRRMSVWSAAWHGWCLSTHQKTEPAKKQPIIGAA